MKKYKAEKTFAIDNLYLLIKEDVIYAEEQMIARSDRTTHPFYNLYSEKTRLYIGRIHKELLENNLKIVV